MRSLWLLALIAPPALAAETATLTASAPSVAASLAQVVFGLVVVLGLILGTAWLGRRLGLANTTRGGPLAVIASTAVGPRERVVIVEAGASWIVVGVAPGSVNHLATLPRGESAPQPATPAGPFAARLAQLLAKQRAH